MAFGREETEEHEDINFSFPTPSAQRSHADRRRLTWKFMQIL